MVCYTRTQFEVFGQNFYLKIRIKLTKKKKYNEHNVYESVDDKSITLIISQKSMKTEFRH